MFFAHICWGRRTDGTQAREGWPIMASELPEALSGISWGDSASGFSPWRRACNSDEEWSVT